MKKVKLTEKQKADLQKLRDEISEYAHQEAWRRAIFAKIKMIELQLKYDWRSDLRREMYLDKFLVTLRPYANRWKHKKNGGRGWKDDA